MSRVYLIVLDGVGCGEMTDANEYGDDGCNTLVNLAEAVGGLKLPTMERMGLGNVAPIKGLAENASTIASFGRMRELSRGKDTITGHWEMMGLISEFPLPTYRAGFPPEIITAFEERIGRSVIGNRPASGTVIIEELGDEHMRTGSPIVYTSADSVFQLAAHEDVIPVQELYAMCETARTLLVPPHNVGRVIARPFTGPPYVRTSRRLDYPLEPPGETLCDILSAQGVPVISVGKVSRMFCDRGFSKTLPATNNAEAMAALDASLTAEPEGLVFANLIDFDMLYGHRNDTQGFARALETFDVWLAGFIEKLQRTDVLIITADHGLDPTTPSTDHTREYVPVLLYQPAAEKVTALRTRMGFSDVAATIAEVFGVACPAGSKRFPPESFLVS